MAQTQAVSPTTALQSALSRTALIILVTLLLGEITINYIDRRVEPVTGLDD
jgi:hypothetical protein